MSDLLEIAAQFVSSLASGETETAHEKLAPEFAAALTVAELSSNYNALAEDMGGVTGVGQPIVILEEWPGMSEQDRAQVYVPLEGDEYSEAVTVIVSEIENTLCIASIEWGRP